MTKSVWLHRFGLNDEIFDMGSAREGKFITKKQACLKQLHAAIDHLRDGNYECAITLAGAAEGQLAGSRKLDFWQCLKFAAAEGRPNLKAVISELNETRDWLKHPTKQLEGFRYLHADEAWIACLRAAMQFVSVFEQQSSKMNRFLKLAEKKGFAPEGKRHEYPPVVDVDLNELANKQQ